SEHEPDQQYCECHFPTSLDSCYLKYPALKTSNAGMQFPLRKEPSIATRVVIVGGGFGGLACARKLAGEPVDVTLVDARDYHLFTPLLYQVATALLNPADIAYPFRAVLRRARNVRFHQATVSGLDFERRMLRTGAGRGLRYA